MDMYIHLLHVLYFAYTHYPNFIQGIYEAVLLGTSAKQHGGQEERAWSSFLAPL